LHSQDFVQVGGGIGANEQDPFSRIGQRNGCGAGQRGLTHATFASEEQISRWAFKDFHGTPTFRRAELFNSSRFRIGSI
jgi:hypothetical protein